jgi:predicted DCC family thiol-disulfide oxidoreductase YuxK
MEPRAHRPADEPSPSPAPVVLFDGVCNLCHGAVGFTIRRDTRRVFRFAPFQSPAARRLLGPSGPDAARPDTVVVIDGDRRLTRSDAALFIAKRLGPPWSFLSLFTIVPRPLRDRLYDLIARNRYAWFGRKSECPVPAPEVRDRFLES